MTCRKPAGRHDGDVNSVSFLFSIFIDTPSKFINKPLIIMKG